MTERIGFFLAIAPKRDAEGNFAGYETRHEDWGIPEEAIIVLVKNWLQTVEERYHRDFTGQQPKE